MKLDTTFSCGACGVQGIPVEDLVDEVGKCRPAALYCVFIVTGTDETFCYGCWYGEVRDSDPNQQTYGGVECRKETLLNGKY